MRSTQFQGLGQLARTVSPHPARPAGSAQVLGSLLDLRSTVKLAQLLERAPAPPAEPSPAPLLLSDYVRKRLVTIEASARKRLAKPFEGSRATFASPEEVREWRATHDAAGSPEGARAFAGRVARSLREHLATSIARVRAEVGALREEVILDLPGLGADAARLVELDGVLYASIGEATPALCERLAGALEPAFVKALLVDVARLHEGDAEAALNGWFAEGGVIALALARVRDVTLTVLAGEGAMVEALVDAACRGGTA
ncbi:MAG TPA: hypothetical protein VGI39_01210 [Polyangiaceae bacterium]|jgi:hypothetical protein